MFKELLFIEMRRQRKMGHITIVGPSMAIVKKNWDSILSDGILDSRSTDVPLVGIIMGPDSDLRVMKGAAEVLKAFGVPSEVTVVSAHRTPERMFAYASSAHERGIEVIIAGAGGAAHLPGMVVSMTCLPVIGVPIKGPSLDGVDSLLSILQMPKGIPVGTVAIENAPNAALLAIRHLGIKQAHLRERMIHYQEEMKETVLRKAQKLETEGWENYS